MPDEKTPLEQALDLFVYAPLGLALTARDQMPDLVEKGRSRVENQMTMAKFVGQFAVQQGKIELEKRLKPYTEPRQPTTRTEPPPAEPAAAVTPTTSAPETSIAGASASNGTGPKAVDLAIHGYDSLSASQVVQRLAGLAAAELEDVRRYEAANRGRKTVLSKISQLQA